VKHGAFANDPSDHSTDIETAVGIGNVACAAVLEFRHRDKSNQLGDLAMGSYSGADAFKFYDGVTH